MPTAAIKPAFQPILSVITALAGLQEAATNRRSPTQVVHTAGSPDKMKCLAPRPHSILTAQLPATRGALATAAQARASHLRTCMAQPGVTVSPSRSLITWEHKEPRRPRLAYRRLQVISSRKTSCSRDSRDSL